LPATSLNERIDQHTRQQRDEKDEYRVEECKRDNDPVQRIERTTLHRFASRNRPSYASPGQPNSMQHPIDEHEPQHVERAIAMIKARLTRFLGIPERASITEPSRKAHIAVTRAQELATA
jgi:hypothetical protein